MRVILLAAGVGRRFGRRTKMLPKCLIPIGKNDENLLTRYLRCFRKLELKNVTLVLGHQKQKILSACESIKHGLSLRFIVNPEFKKGSIVSLYAASKDLREDCLIMDADVYFPIAALKKLLRSGKKTAFLIDDRSKFTGEEMMLMAKNGRPVEISKRVDPKLKLLGEATGFFNIRKGHAKKIKKILSDFIRRKKTDAEYEESYNALMKTEKVGIVRIGNTFWTEMDFEEDLRKIRNLKP